MRAGASHTRTTRSRARRSTRSFIEPCFATPRSKAPAGAQWLFEIKYDGYRTQAHVHDGEVVLFTRRGYDWTETFSHVASALAPLKARDAILDGEIVALDARGIASYKQLQSAIASKRSERLTYFVFDLLHLDGEDLRRRPLHERKRMLERLLRALDSNTVRYCEHIEADGAQVFANACAMHLEGVIAKHKDAPYASGRQETWLKLKCKKSDAYPIVAFVEKLGAKPRRIASLYLGRRENGRLLYAGKAQTGFTQASLYELRERLDPYIRKTTPLDEPIKKPKATWVEPELLAEVEYSSTTADGLLREPIYKGLRDDLSVAPPLLRERVGAGRVVPKQYKVPKENILQLLPDAVVPSKEQLAKYWTRMADRALEHLARRPLKLVRSLRGVTFYHMGPLPPIPRAVHQLKLKKREGGEGVRLWVDDLEGLLGLLEIGAIELHPWNATVDDIERADRLVFDLDPGEGVAWDFVVESAFALRDLLRREGLDCWPKLTGGKGLHLMAPLAKSMKHDAAREYCKALASRLLQTHPGRYTLTANLDARAGRLFIDYLRNGRGTTAVGAYSPRARPGFPIAAPTTWKKVEAGIRPDAYTLERPLRAPT